MNWKEELAEMFKERKRDYTIENYQKAKNEIILPTFKEIEDLLREYDIHASVDKSSEELTVDAWGLVMKTEFNVENVKFTFKFYSTLKEDVTPPLLQSSEKLISIEELTAEIIGELFVEALKPMKIFYTPINI